MNLKKMNNFCVFGLSFGGRQFVRKCIKYGYKINAILDNDKKKDGKKFCGIPIMLPENGLKIGIKNIFLVGRHISVQEKQLLELGVPKKNIFYIPRKDIALSGNYLDRRNKLTLSFLQTISEVCASLNIEIWLDYSGLLTAARNQGLGSLSDFDLMLTGKLKSSILLRKLFEARTDWIIKNYYSSKYLDQLGTSIMSWELEEKLEPAVIDLRGLNTNPIFRKYPNLIEKYYNKSSKYLEKTNIKYPNNYKEYLNKLYGKNWKVPEDFYEPSY